MSFTRYYNETRDRDGEALWWPGGPGGYPFRGPSAPYTKNQEYTNLQLTGKAHCRVFSLAIEKDANEYIIIREKCANGLYCLLDREKVWDAETSNYKIFMEWLELAYELPPPNSEKINESESAPSAVIKLAGLRKDW